jgi:molybdopterin molybdotransferase
MPPALAALHMVFAWIEAHVSRLDAEDVPFSEAVGRVLAEDVLSAIDAPDSDRAAADGLALRADETAGAGPYNPLRFRSAPPDQELPFGAGVLVNAGDPLPAGADAIARLETIEPAPPDGYEVIEGVARGNLVLFRAGQISRRAHLLAKGRRLQPHDVGVLAAAAIQRTRVVRRPRVSCLIVGAACEGFRDVDGPLLRALVARDGGDIEIRRLGRDRAELLQALAEASADAVIITGGSGPGANDCSAAVLAEAGDLAIHGVALNPGGTAGCGLTVTGAPAFLLPGSPADCLWAYEFFAGHAIRLLGGRDSSLPFPTQQMRVARKIVSAIGLTEVVPLRRLGPDLAEPLPSIAETGLAAADGFAIMGEGSEGIAEGGAVTAYITA